MLSNLASLILGCVFVLLAAANVWLILESSSRRASPAHAARLVAAHRIAGYAFIAMFCVMSYLMVARLRASGTPTPPLATIHLALAIVLAPLLFLKVLLARHYKNQSATLMPLGLLIFVLAFVLIVFASGPYFARPSKIETVSSSLIGMPDMKLDVDAAESLMQQRCSKCHNLDRVVGARKDLTGWRQTILRMQSLPSAGLSDADVQTVVAYLSSRSPAAEPGAQRVVARALVDQRCGRCHNLDRVYVTAENPAEWRKIVSRMVEYADGSANAIRPAEAAQILDFLSLTQTPEAVQQRRTIQGRGGPSRASGNEKIIRPSQPIAKSSKYDLETFGFGALVCVGCFILAIRRPKPVAQSKSPAVALPVARSTQVLLTLVGIAPQTPDAKTLRFAVPTSVNLRARPGQFLTFSVLFDGKKEIRCYSICSSPARSGYVEITPKRASSGNVSVFLNDRAAVGLTVEAAGPFGEFYFDPECHKRIVLIAAGSGITPMIAMLRYIDDLRLTTEATLLYCVRTTNDIMFRADLDKFEGRLTEFRYHVLLSQEKSEWRGWRGRISREFVLKTVKGLDSPVFFLCGPPPFMAAAMSILEELGVKPERIHQERFGDSAPQLPVADSAKTAFTVDFVRSGILVTTRNDQTLLALAEQHGVAIPYACRQGQCGTCKTLVLDGTVSMDTEQGLDQESKARGFALMCVGHAGGIVKLDV